MLDSCLRVHSDGSRLSCLAYHTLHLSHRLHSTVCCRSSHLGSIYSTGCFLGERMELELDIELCQRCVIGLAHRESIKIQVDGKVITNRHKLFRQARILRMREKSFTRPFLCQLRGMRKDGFKMTILTNQLASRLFADSLYAWNVVRRITNEGQIVRHKTGWYPKPLCTVLNTNPVFFHTRWATAAWIQ